MQLSKQNFQKRNKKSTKPPIRGLRETSEHPPQINGYEVTHSQTLRFTATAAAVNTAVTFANLLDTMLVATTAIASFDLFDLVKIKKVSIWGQAALGTPSTVQLTYFGSNTVAEGQVHTDTSLGVRPAYIQAKPSNRSLASFFSTALAVTAFTVTCPAGSIIDVHIVFRTSSTAPVAAANAIVAGVAGEFYFRGLDGLAIAGTNFPPPTGVPSR